MALLDGWRRRPRPAPLHFPEVEGLAEALATLREIGGDDAIDEQLADLAIRVWTVRKVLSRRADGVPTRMDVTVLQRHAEAMQRLLGQLDVSIQDLDREPFVDGMMVEVVERCDDPSLDEATIIQTTAPLVLRAGRRLRQAAVVVAGPPEQSRSS